ncbi:MAG: hypothetical protein PUC42_14035 [Bacteroidales bacterium]|jgi:hypothetical protein|nr:hypothetical protein [Bacteroidales bacterium]
MKYLFTFSLVLINTIVLSAEPRGRYYDDGDFSLGLASGKEVGLGVLIGIAAIVFGQLLIRVKSDSDKSDNVGICGCLGIILHGVGVISLLPLVHWIFTIASAIYSIGIPIIAVLVVIFFIIHLFSSKK